MFVNLSDMRSVMLARGQLGHLAGAVPAYARTDSRQVGENDVFFCIEGERTDGHLYAAQAVEAGAVAVVAQKDPPEWPVQSHCALLQVENVVEAMGRLANRCRNLSRAMIIGVTGTAGKTTVKEMIASILSQAGDAACNPGNLNTQIGMAMSMMNMTGQEDFWVLEAGINKPCDMDELGEILEPDLAVVLNVGAAHLEGLGTVEGVAKAKARLLAHLRPAGIGVIGGDYPELLREAAELTERLAVFSTQDHTAHFFGAYLGPQEDGLGGKYYLKLGSKELELTLPFRGALLAENCIAAATAAVVLGLEPQHVRDGLEKARGAKGRLQQSQTGKWLIIDDSYNANPMSMSRALEAAPDLAGGKPLVLVLGEMRELGETAALEHAELGERAAQTGATAVFWVGGYGSSVRQGLVGSRWTGVWKELENEVDLLRSLDALRLEEGAILFKGSRGNKLETYVQAVQEGDD